MKTKAPQGKNVIVAATVGLMLGAGLVQAGGSADAGGDGRVHLKAKKAFAPGGQQPRLDAGSNGSGRAQLKAKKAFDSERRSRVGGGSNGDGRAHLKAKKAFHEGRQDIQSIRKGDEKPRSDVPTYFGD